MARDPWKVEQLQKMFRAEQAADPAEAYGAHLTHWAGKPINIDVDGLKALIDCYSAERNLSNEKNEATASISNSLILPRYLADFGESLKLDCPKNDCAIFRNVYNMYCEQFADYKQIVATLPTLSETTLRTLRQSILHRELELTDMWNDNYAVEKQRCALYGEDKTQREKQFRKEIAAQSEKQGRKSILANLQEKKEAIAAEGKTRAEGSPKRDDLEH